MNHSGTVELVSERLILRRFREADAEQIFSSFLNDEGFLYYANKEPKTLEQEKEALKGIGERYNSKEYYNWLITLKDEPSSGRSTCGWIMPLIPWNSITRWTAATGITAI